MLNDVERAQSVTGEPVLHLYFERIGLAMRLFHQAIKSRALRGFRSGGPTRTRTVDQRIMSPLL